MQIKTIDEVLDEREVNEHNNVIGQLATHLKSVDAKTKELYKRLEELEQLKIDIRAADDTAELLTYADISELTTRVNNAVFNTTVIQGGSIVAGTVNSAYIQSNSILASKLQSSIR